MSIALLRPSMLNSNKIIFPYIIIMFRVYVLQFRKKFLDVVVFDYWVGLCSAVCVDPLYGWITIAILLYSYCIIKPIKKFNIDNKYATMFRSINWDDFQRKLNIIIQYNIGTPLVGQYCIIILVYIFNFRSWSG